MKQLKTETIYELRNEKGEKLMDSYTLDSLKAYRLKFHLNKYTYIEEVTFRITQEFTPNSKPINRVIRYWEKR